MALPNNERLWYACQLVGISDGGDVNPNNIIEAHGVQSVGITTSFNITDVTELAMSEAYELIEGVPDVEVTLEKVIDGYPLLYHLCSVGAASLGFSARRKARADIRLGLYPDDEDFADGDPGVEVYCSGMHLNSVSYTLPVDGSCTESVTLIGANKEWLEAPNTVLSSIQTGNIGGSDQPKALTDFLGGVQQRENVDMELSILPLSIRGVTQSAVAGNNWANGAPKAHIQNVAISADFSKEALNELGQKSPYTRVSAAKITVSTEISVITTEGDFVNAYENGDPAFDGTINEGNNTVNETMKFVLDETSTFDLGTKNRLNSITYGGGDADGGNVTTTYSYTNINALDITHAQDPHSLAP
jgi:hypothetical protein